MKITNCRDSQSEVDPGCTLRPGHWPGKLWQRLPLFWKNYAVTVVVVTFMIAVVEASEMFFYSLPLLSRLPGTDSQKEVIAWVVVVIMGTLSISYILTRFTLKPFQLLLTASQKLADGRLNTRISGETVSRQDEVGELTRGFNQMAEALASTIETERRLLRDISHELRSPLARLRLATNLIDKKLNGGEMGPEASFEDSGRSLGATKTYLDQIEADLILMDDLIEQLLEHARLEMAESHSLLKEFRFDQLDLVPIIRAATSAVKLSAAQEGKAVELTLPDKLTINGDSRLMRRLIDNLLKNALQYTRLDSTVILNLEKQEGSALLTIIDQGPGVAPSHLKSIFKPFYRADDSRSRHNGGFGLGLAIAWQIANLHKGTIRADNRAPVVGGGLKVTVTIPYKAS